MNVKVKEHIRASFCPRSNWVQDKDVSNCFKCDAKFTFFTRKHHCRMCGKIFCSECLIVVDFNDICDSDKSFKACESCYKKCWKCIMDNDPVYYNSEKAKAESITVRLSGSNLTIVEPGTPTLPANAFSKANRVYRSQEEKLKELKSLFDCPDERGEQPQTLAELKQHTEVRISMLIQIMLKSNKLSFEYYTYLVELVHKINKDVPPNALVTRNMNITKNIKFRCVRGESINDTKYIVGTVIKKGVTSKRMALSYNNVNVILVYANVEASDILQASTGNASFEELIEKRKREFGKLADKLKEMQVGIIFLEGTIEKEAQDLFFESGITVITKIRVEMLSRLKISLEIPNIVERIGKIDEYNPNTIVGKVKHMYFTHADTFDDPQGDLLVVEGHRAENGLTILLSGPDEQELKKIKREIKPILIVARHLELKMYKILLDQELVQSMKPEVRASVFRSDVPNLFFSLAREKDKNTATYLKNKYLSYKRIVFVESDFHCFPDVPKSDIHEYVQSRKTKSFRRRWPFFTDICIYSAKDEVRRFYSEDDWPMGEYLLKKMLNIDKKCDTCRKPGYQHVEVYYTSNLHVKIETETRILMDRKSVGEEEGTDDYCKMEDIYGELAKQKEKNKFKCFIECKDCHEELTPQFSVRREHLELSLLSFLTNIFVATNTSKINDFSEEPTRVNGQCQHREKVRVFRLGSAFLRVEVDFLSVSRPKAMGPAGRDEFLKLKDFKHLKECCLQEKIRVEKVVTFLQEEMKKVTELTKNTNFEEMYNDPKGSFIKAKQSFRENKNFLTQSQCVDILIPELLEQINRIDRMALFLINQNKARCFLESHQTFYNLMVLLKKIFKIITEVRKAIQKRELNLKYQNREDELENSQAFDEIDINALAAEESDNLSVSGASDVHNTSVLGELHANDKDETNTDYNVTEADTEQNRFDHWVFTQQAEEAEDALPLNRRHRKTESSINKKEKPTEACVNDIFKNTLSLLKSETAFLQSLHCNPYESHTLIASALNSFMHKDIITGDLQHESLKIKFNSTNDFELVQETDEMKKILTVLENQENILMINKKSNNPALCVDVNILYPASFNKLRASKGIPIELFVLTIAGAESWLSTGGKSGCPFMRSHNDIAVIKKVPEREFTTLKKMLPGYFDHLKKGSLLTPIYGGFEVTKGGKTEYYIVMENLFFGMNSWQIYDFKGFKTHKRFSKPPIVPLDVNFQIDRNSEPLFTSWKPLQSLNETLDFMLKHNVIDYSLVLVVDAQSADREFIDGCPIRLGVVDYLREFGVKENVEKLFKGTNATVMEPLAYKERLLSHIHKYFWEIPGI